MKNKLIISLLLVTSLTLVGCNNSSEYRSKLQEVSDAILDNSSKAESIAEQYANVWNFSIESKGAIPVREMAVVTGLEENVITENFEINNAGNIPNDFSTNVYSLNSYYEKSGELGEITDAAEKIKEQINELNDPPKEFEKVYEELLDLYTYSEEYIELVLNPSGSLQEFNKNKNQLTNDILSKHKRIEAIIPNEE